MSQATKFWRITIFAALTATVVAVVLLWPSIVDEWELRSIPQRPGVSARPDAATFVRLADMAMAECEKAGNYLATVSNSDDLFSMQGTAQKIEAHCENAQVRLNALALSRSVGRQAYRMLDDARDFCSDIADNRQSAAGEIQEHLSRLAEQGSIAEAKKVVKEMATDLGMCRSSLMAGLGSLKALPL